MIKDLIVQLRKAADALEFISTFDNSEKVAKSVYMINYPKLKKKKHWTQLPKNKARLKKMLMKAHEARRLKNKE